MPDVNDIKAGEYELLVDLWDQPTNKPGEPFTFKRYVRGDLVTLDETEAQRLVLAGAVGEPGAREKAQAEALKAQYLAALAAVPDYLRAQITEEQALEAAQREPAVEELTVHTAPGFPNEGPRPRVAQATVGEGTGGPEAQEQADTPEEVAEQAEQSTSTVDAAKRSGRTGRGA